MTEGGLPLPVTFFLPGEEDLEALRGIDPDSDWRELARGERAWILQTWLRLRRAGLPVRLLGDEAEALPVGLVVFHAKHRKAVAARYRELPRSEAAKRVLVGVRADNRQPLIADLEILQNGCYADGERRFAVPHWPQAGLVPRDPARGTAIERIGYKGFTANLHTALRAQLWWDFLIERGIHWVTDNVAFNGARTDVGSLAWNDYSELDVVVALRPPDPGLHTGKPATKLVNAWRAGVPAILGPETAYRELRESPLDYLEAATLVEAQEAVDRLVGDPDLYRRMVEHGRRRARGFDFPAVTAAWRKLVTEALPRAAERARARPLARLPLALRVQARRVGRWLEGRPAR